MRLKGVKGGRSLVHFAKVFALMAFVVLVGAGAAPNGQSTKPFGGALPLWEPAWSPVLLLPGESMYPPVDMPNAFAVADVDGDGIQELLVGGDYLHVLSIRNGELHKHYLTVVVGFQKFVGPSRERLGVLRMAVGDLDGDGLEDLVVATKEGQLWVLGNHGGWAYVWRPGSPYAVAAHLLWVHDHTGDGALDVLGVSGSRLFVLPGDGKEGRLGDPIKLSGPAGDLWLAGPGAYRGRPGFFVLARDGVWFFPQGEVEGQHVLAVQARSLVVADFDRDGTDDLALGAAQELTIYRGTPEGLGAPKVLSLGHGVGWLRAGDVQGDGFPDLIVGRLTPAGFTLFYNVCGEEFLGFSFGISVPALGGLPPMAPKGIVADLDGDGRDDLVVEASPYHLAFFLAGAKGRTLLDIPGSLLLGTADVNHDGLLDVLVDTVEGGVAALLAGPRGLFTSRPLVEPSKREATPYIARFGDVTGDKKDELVVFEFAKGHYPVWNPRRKTWDWYPSDVQITAWDLEDPREPLWSVPVGKGVLPLLFLFDLDGDGVRDGVTAAADKVVGVNFAPTAGPWEQRIRRHEVSLGGLVGPLALLRLAGQEVLAAFRVTEKVELLLVRKGGEVQETGVALEVAPLDLGVGDMDGDGDDDLVLIGWGALREEGEAQLAVYVAILLADGLGGFQPVLFPIKDWPPLAMPFPYGGLALADLDRDGDLDLACMRVPDQEGNPGGVVVLLRDQEGFRAPVLLPGCVGTKLFALDSLLLTVPRGTPAYLCLLSWEVER